MSCRQLWRNLLFEKKRTLKIEVIDNKDMWICVYGVMCYKGKEPFKHIKEALMKGHTNICCSHPDLTEEEEDILTEIRTTLEKK